MLTNFTLVKYNREAHCLSGNWVLTEDGGRLLECDHDSAIKWYDKNCKNTKFCRYSNLSVKQLTERELGDFNNRSRNSLWAGLWKSASKFRWDE